MKSAPRRPVNPILLRRIVASGINQKVFAQRAGFPNYNQYYQALHWQPVKATPLVVARLTKLAEILRQSGIDFRDADIFLDEPPAPRLVKRATALEATE